MRKIDELFERYGESHRHPTNKAIHWVCVPLITWSLIALLWVASPALAYAFIVAATLFYLRLSFPIAMQGAAVRGYGGAPHRLCRNTGDGVTSRPSGRALRHTNARTATSIRR